MFSCVLSILFASTADVNVPTIFPWKDYGKETANGLAISLGKTSMFVKAALEFLGQKPPPSADDALKLHTIISQLREHTDGVLSFIKRESGLSDGSSSNPSHVSRASADLSDGSSSNPSHVIRSSNSLSTPRKLCADRDNDGDDSSDGTPNTFIAYVVDKKAPSGSQEIQLTPTFLFMNPLLLPQTFCRNMISKLSYLTDCGLTPTTMRAYFDKNWSRIKMNPVLLDVNCDVGLCHVQAAVSHILLSKYSDHRPEVIPNQIMAYFVCALMLFDHSDVRNGRGSFQYLHHPEHARGLKLIDESTGLPLPLPYENFGYARPSAKKMDPVGFFARLRMVVASQALLFAADFGDKRVPNIEENNVSGIPLPKTPYPETFRMLFDLMRRNEIPFLVEVVHVFNSATEGEHPQLSSEFGHGFYPPASTAVDSSRESEYVMVLQMFTSGLSTSDRMNVLDQLCNFDIMEAINTEIVYQTKGDGSRAVSPDRPLVEGWLKAVFAPETSKTVSLFDDKFCAGYVRRLVREGRVGIAPRHLYCSTRAKFREELLAARTQNKAKAPDQKDDAL